VLILENISLRLGTFALKNFSLKTEQGEYLVLLGPTGTGKTVLLETIAGLHRPSAGTISLAGHDITRMAPEKRHLGVVYQEYALFPHLSVAGNIGFGLRMRGYGRAGERRAVEEMAAFLGIDHLLQRMPKTLSGGEQQRVALARALVLKPQMLLLDEPLSALDRMTKERFVEELKQIHRKLGITILHITHDLGEACFLADRLAILRDGVLLQTDSPDRIMTRPQDRFVAELVGHRNFLRARIMENGRAEIPGLPGSDAVLADPPDRGQEVDILLPQWQISIGESQDRGWWRGPARIAALSHGERELRLDLELPDTTLIQTTLSRREQERTDPLVQGASVQTTVHGTALHWLAAEG
jgi:ABC-type Fe3+/spermidine/putrescine transport system ATPase subunit